MRNKSTTEEQSSYTHYWLQLCDSYFEATITPDEEKALASFLATPESNTPEFNEIKAVMGYTATARSLHKQNTLARRKPRHLTRWAAAATIALLLLTGSLLTVTHNSENDIYLAYIDGREYTDKDFVMQHMHNTMTRMSNCTSHNTIEEQLGAMFRITQ